MKDLDVKFRMAFFPQNSQLTLQPPGGTHYDGPYGEAPPEGASFYGRQAGCQKWPLTKLDSKI